MIRNYSKGIDYHSQRNNRVVPYSSCNTTSAIMALKQAGWDIADEIDGKQPEDYLSLMLRTDEAFAKMKELAPWAAGAYPPQEVHACLEWGINLFMGADVDRFTANAQAAELVAHVDAKGGVILSGRFPLEGGDLGHIVSLAGYAEEEQLPGVLSEWIVDDPYGNWHTGYADYRGNDVALTDEQFKVIFKKSSGYWAHFIRSAS